MMPKDYTKQGILNWICIQDDDRDMTEVIRMCYRKIEAMNTLREFEKRTNTKTYPIKKIPLNKIEEMEEFQEGNLLINNFP